MSKKVEREKTTQEKWDRRNNGLAIAGLVLILVGVFWATVCMAEPSMYQKLRSDDYMDDPTIPFNERDNATYTFTDEWLSEQYNRLIWWVMPGAILIACGYAMVYLPGLIGIDEKTIHKEFCRQWQNEKYSSEDGPKDMTYCPECGLKLSRLEKD